MILCDQILTYSKPKPILQKYMTKSPNASALDRILTTKINFQEIVSCPRKMEGV
jgi:hypothetical protein